MVPKLQSDDLKKVELYDFLCSCAKAHTVPAFKNGRTKEYTLRFSPTVNQAEVTITINKSDTEDAAAGRYGVVLSVEAEAI